MHSNISGKEEKGTHQLYRSYLDNSSCTAETYPVSATIGPMMSGSAMFVAELLGLADIPVLSPFASIDELSDVGRFPYFLRLVK
mgnify:CR=1 FL=1